jgi:hypothetical protein
MVSERCRKIVASELTKLGIAINTIDFGIADTQHDVSIQTKKKLKISLRKSGLDLITDNKLILIEKIKNTIIEAVHYSDELIKTNFSDYMSKKLNYNYTYLANVFPK